jgi:hypothetical protein
VGTYFRRPAPLTLVGGGDINRCHARAEGNMMKSKRTSGKNYRITRNLQRKGEVKGKIYSMVENVYSVGKISSNTLLRIFSLTGAQMQNVTDFLFTRPRTEKFIPDLVESTSNLLVLWSRGLYIGKYPPMSFGGKNMKRRREKGGKCKRKGRKVKEKWRKGKEN